MSSSVSVSRDMDTSNLLTKDNKTWLHEQESFSGKDTKVEVGNYDIVEKTISTGQDEETALDSVLDKGNTIPSRFLELRYDACSPKAEDDIGDILRRDGQLKSLEHLEEDGYYIAAFYDIQDAIKSQDYLNRRVCDGYTIFAEFSTQPTARDFDEEGRIVVRVEEHLQLKELYHIFSTYGAVRNIQDVPNINVHKVVEFCDVRDAERATEALNCVSGDVLHAASVAYIEKTRFKLFLIPQRLSTAMNFEKEKTDHLSHGLPKTLPLCGAKKQTLPNFGSSQNAASMLQDCNSDIAAICSETSIHQKGLRPLRDSSSSLTSVGNVKENPDMAFSVDPEKELSLLMREDDQEQKLENHSEHISVSKTSHMYETSFSDGWIQEEAAAFLPRGEKLPTELGLYEDESRTLHTDAAVDASATFGNHLLNNDILSQTKPNIPSSIFTSNMTQQTEIERLRSMLASESASKTLLSKIAWTDNATLASLAQLGLLDINLLQQQRMLVAQCWEKLQQATILQQPTLLEQILKYELLKLVNWQKVFGNINVPGNSSMFQFPKAEDQWKRNDKNNRKKNSRLNRRTSAIDNQQEAERRAQQEKMFALDLERVECGEDQRTTLMIKNIPNKYTQRMLLARIEQEFKGTFDFFYLPIDFKNKCNVGYGFINMTKVEHIPPFVQHVHEQKWDKFNSDKVCCVTYARIQGRSALINHFQNSSLMLEESKHQPLLFDSNGDPESFPIETIKI